MSLESATYVSDLTVTNPTAADVRSEGDDHLRLIKTTLKNTFPGMAGRFNRLQSKGSNYTAVLNDATSLISASAALTLTLTAAATLGNGWSVCVYAAGGAVTIDGNASETINEETTCVVPYGHGGWLVCDGSGFSFFGWVRGAGDLPGDLKATARTAAPSGWLLCYGQEVSRTTYAALFDAISTTFGVGDGSTTFNLPDLRGRVIAGQDDMGGSSANRLTGLTDGVNGDTFGATGGLESTALTSAQLASHTHGLGTLAVDSGGVDHTHSVAGTTVGVGGGTAGGGFGSAQNTGGASAYNHTHTVSGALASTGSGDAHNNVQPTIILNYIIKT